MSSTTLDVVMRPYFGILLFPPPPQTILGFNNTLSFCFNSENPLHCSIAFFKGFIVPSYLTIDTKLWKDRISNPLRFQTNKYLSHDTTTSPPVNTENEI